MTINSTRRIDMKKEYATPQIELVELTDRDVLAASSIPDNEPLGDE